MYGLCVCADCEYVRIIVNRFLKHAPCLNNKNAIFRTVSSVMKSNQTKSEKHSQKSFHYFRARNNTTHSYSSLFRRVLFFFFVCATLVCLVFCAFRVGSAYCFASLHTPYLHICVLYFPINSM